MRPFYQKAFAKLDKMDFAAVRGLFRDLSREYDLLGMVLDSLTDGVVVTDRRHRILTMNKAAERLIPFLYRDSHELHERPVWESIADADIAGFLRPALTDFEKVRDQEFTLADKQRNRVIALAIMPLVRDRRIKGSVVHVEDVTEERAEEARLRRAESLAALTTLTAGVAHEIKNPLQSMSIHLQLIDKAIAAGSRVDTDAVTGNVSVIKEEVERLNKIVVDYLLAVRPMNARLEQDDINELLRSLMEFLKLELERNDITVRIDLGEGLARVRLDARLMREAILNLVKNAMGAMPEGGTLTVRTRMSADSVTISVADTGPGIEDAILGKIFEPYFTTKDFGSGLGLTLVYKIVKEHLGEISVDSRPGQGATFMISLPIPQTERRLLQFKEAVG